MFTVPKAVYSVFAQTFNSCGCYHGPIQLNLTAFINIARALALAINELSMVFETKIV